MIFHHWLIYLSVIFVIIVTPGPSAALCLTNGAMHGRFRTFATVLGGMLASLILMSLSALGLGAAIAASDTLFQIIKLIGAIYLILMGVSIWRSSPSTSMLRAGKKPRANSPSLLRLFRQGFLVGISNPKDLLFFGALFPQFVDPSSPMITQMFVLAVSWLAIDGLVMFSYSAFGSKLVPGLRRLEAQKTINRVAGGAFIIAGGALAVAQK
jgi:homoserine/homoserine lactone efflux protein